MMSGAARPRMRLEVDVLEALGGQVRVDLGRCDVGEAGRARVALDDLVEALPGQAAAALVDEQVALVTQADQRRTPALDVYQHRGDRLAADRDEALLAALAPGAQHGDAQ